MSVDRIATLLTQKTGLAPAALGADAVAQAVRRRMAECGLTDDGCYEQRLSTSNEEWQSFVDEVVVKETWFFRDWTPFVFLGRHVREQWRPAHPGRALHALSVPCATGEEACSIAIALLDAGLAGRSFQIDAVDLSRAAIAKCRDGAYGDSSFRGGRRNMYERYFTAGEDGRRPLPEVTANITFRRGNLLEPGFAAGHGPYDIIFCRNLLIYFDPAARKVAAENLHRLLADDGILFAGHTESTYTLGARFASLDEPQAFAYRKVLAPAQKTTPLSPGGRGTGGEGAAPELAHSRAALSWPPKQKPEQAAPAEPAPAQPAPVDDSLALLDRASRLADEGSLDAAAAICRQLLERDNPHPDAFCLLGVIEEASGRRSEAENCYNRALFLDPQHFESLIHLTLLVESRGDAARAAALRARAERLREAENRHAG